MKTRSMLAATLLTSLLLPAAAQAQFLVLDAANLTQAMEQIAAWKRQYQQLQDQKAQLQQQYAANTGSRGLGAYASNPQLQAVVPSDIQNTYLQLQNLGGGGLKGSARLLRDTTKIYDCEDRSGTDAVACQRLLNNGAQRQALIQGAMALTNQRVAQIQTLQDKINATTDAKSIAELQARLQAENTQVSNDANRLTLMRAMADAADSSAEQAIREKAMKSLARHNDGSETFTFTPPVWKTGP